MPRHECAAQLEQWKRAGAIGDAQSDALNVRRDRFPVFLELNALFYLGCCRL
jgi:hypothetical protein